MNMGILILMISTLIPTMLTLMMKSMSMKSSMNREKSSPYECGFDPKTNARTPFSLRFFLLAIIFIVFDIEIVLLMPIPTMNMTLHFPHILLTYTMFLIILTLGLIHEWSEGSLDWAS